MRTPKIRSIRFLELAASILLITQMAAIEKCHIEPLVDNGPGWNRDIALKAEVDCPYGSADCNPCIDDLLTQLENLSTESESSTLYGFRNGDQGHKMDLFKHPQGIARLPGVDNDNWLLMTKNHPRDEGLAGVASLHFPEVESNGFAWSNDNDGSRIGEIKQFYSTYDNKHPGGCQIIGHHLAVAHEAVVNGIPDPTWISFYDVSRPDQMNESNRFAFDGLDAMGVEYFMTDKGQAMCVGITRLANGHYFMLALESRRRLPSDVGWFFLSTSANLETTEWEYIQFWHQEYLLPDRDAFRTYENINLVSDCSDGSIYMLGFFGKGKSNAIDVFHIKIVENQQIVLEKVFEKKVRTRSGGATFRAGAGIHVTPENKVVLYSIEKAKRDEWITIEEFTQRTPTPRNLPSTTISAN